MPESSLMPVLFVGHGSPMNAIEDNRFSRTWRQVGESLPHPRAILCISAHWETQGTGVTAATQPHTIHDFGGFPRALYEVEYPAPGSPELAAKVKQIVHSADVVMDEGWGLDHGCWSVLRQMYPKAEIPVVQLSLDYTQPARFHYDLGRELAPLREEGILILASGNLVHNLSRVVVRNFDLTGFNQEFGLPWALEASALIKKLIDARDHASLIDYPALGTAVRLAVPTPEHYLPALYALALQGENEKINYFNDVPVAGSLTMTGFIIQ